MNHLRFLNLPTTSVVQKTFLQISPVTEIFGSKIYDESKIRYMTCANQDNGAITRSTSISLYRLLQPTDGQNSHLAKESRPSKVQQIILKKLFVHESRKMFFPDSKTHSALFTWADHIGLRQFPYFSFLPIRLPDESKCVSATV